MGAFFNIFSGWVQVFLHGLKMGFGLQHNSIIMDISE